MTKLPDLGCVYPSGLPACLKGGVRLLRRWLLLVLLGLSSAAGAENSVSSGVAFDKLLESYMNGQTVLGSQADEQHFLQELRRLLPKADSRRSRLYRFMYCNMAFQNQVEAGFRYASEQLALAKAEGDLAGQASFRLCLGGFREMKVNVGAAVEDYSAAIELARQVDEPMVLGNALKMRGAVLSYLGEPAAGLKDLLEAIAIFESQQRQGLVDNVVIELAIAYRRLGEFAKAEEYLQKAKAHAQASQNLGDEMIIELQLSFLAVDTRRYADAEAAALRALRHLEKKPSATMSGSVYISLAQALTLQGRYAEALNCLKRAEGFFAEAGDISNNSMLTLQRARAYAGLGKRHEALVYFEQAAELLEKDGNMRYRASLYEWRGQSYALFGMDAEALADARRYSELHAKLDRNLKAQFTAYQRFQFDSERQDAEIQRLSLEREMTQASLALLQNLRRWQSLAIVLTGLLVLMLASIAVRQWLRSRRLQAQAMTDELTGVANRRSILLSGREAFAPTGPGPRRLSVLAIDIDHFKRINDRYGHAEGDKVLQRVALACARGLLRPCDKLGRTGGEEFLALLPDTTAGQASLVAERLRAAVAALDYEGLGLSEPVTVSIGLAERCAEDGDLERLIQRADNALYQAKQAGRNCVAQAQQLTPPSERP